MVSPRSLRRPWAVASARGEWRLDVRGLALFRMALGLASLVEIAELWAYREAFLSSKGVCPQHKVKGPHSFDLFFAAQGDGATSLLLVLNFLAASAFACGLWSRLATVISWLFAVSLHHRFSGCVDYGGDQLRAQLLFWCMFIPLGSVWSVDAYLDHCTANQPRLAVTTESSDCEESKDRRRAQSPLRLRTVHPEGTLAKPPRAARSSSSKRETPGEARPATYSAPTSAFLILLQLAIMYAYTASKKTGETWVSGRAVEAVLHLPQYSREPMAGLLVQLPLLCHLLSSATLWVERCGWCLAFMPFSRARLAALVLFGGLHFGMNLALRVGNFQLFAMSAWLVVTPPSVLNSIQVWLLPWAWMRHRAPTKFAEAHRRPPLVRVIGWVLTIMALLLMTAGMAEACAQSGQKHCSLAKYVDPGRGIRGLLAELGLIQRWNMFAPDAPTRTLRVSIVGIVALHGRSCTLESNRYWEVCRVAPLWGQDGFPIVHVPVEEVSSWGSLQPPARTKVDFATNRWRKLMENKNNSKAVGAYICQQWRIHRSPREKLLGIWFTRARSTPPQTEEVYKSDFKYWCHAETKDLMMSLPLPSWVTSEKPKYK